MKRRRKRDTETNEDKKKNDIKRAREVKMEWWTWIEKGRERDTQSEGER